MKTFSVVIYLLSYTAQRLKLRIRVRTLTFTCMSTIIIIISYTYVLYTCMVSLYTNTSIQIQNVCYTGPIAFSSAFAIIIIYTFKMLILLVDSCFVLLLLHESDKIAKKKQLNFTNSARKLFPQTLGKEAFDMLFYVK